MIGKRKKLLKKYNDFITQNSGFSLAEYMYVLHDVYPIMDSSQKEDAYLFTLINYQETIAYAMLKLSSLKLDVTKRFREEYKSSYKQWLENIETDLYIGFGDDKIFLTYAKLYIYGMNTHVDKLIKQIENKFSTLTLNLEE